MERSVSTKVAEFFSQYPLRTYRKGQILVHASDAPAGVYYLAEGRVKQYDVTYRGDEIILNTFKPGAFFPMSYAINRTINDYFLEAEADIAVRRAPADDVVGFIKANPDVLYDLLGRVYRGTEGLLGRMTHLMGGSARSRVLYELLIECRRFGAESDGGVRIEVTETDIAARAGLARETVNREIHKLKQEHIVEITAKYMVVCDPAAISKLLGIAV